MLTFIDHLAARIAEAKAVFVDWDGCIVAEGSLLPGAASFLRLTASKVFILSNNSTHLPEDFQAILAQEGISLPADRIILAGCQTLVFATQDDHRDPIHLIANDQLTAHARAAHLTLVDDLPKTVILMRDTGFSYAKLERAVNYLRAGARLVVSNPDLTHPAGEGAVVPETGALLAALAACVDLSTLEVEVVGKPSPHLYNIALARAGITPSETVMIGDNPLTDIAGAERLGITSILLSPDGVTLSHLAHELAALAEASRGQKCL